MKWLRWPLLGLGLVIATGLVLTGIGAMLPPEHTESIEVTVDPSSRIKSGNRNQ